MAYSELIKDFGRIRRVLRSFYVYCFRHRNDYDEKSARSYDNERRRIESWLGEYMSFGQDAEGKRVFLSVDSRAIPENPLYRAFRTKSFTDGDIMLHFYLLDILSEEEGLSITEVMADLEDYLSEFDSDEYPDESTVRKKLGEYAALGLLRKEKCGRETLYFKTADAVNLDTWESAIRFASEAAPLGVIGSFFGGRLQEKRRFFRFKHHYILNALDSEIMAELLTAMEERRLVRLKMQGGSESVALPLRFYISTQTGRQYLLAGDRNGRNFFFVRLDLIDRVRPEQLIAASADELHTIEQSLSEFTGHLWGVSSGNRQRLESLEMTLRVDEGEDFIIRRLEREKRCGSVEQLDDRHWRFSSEVYDALEMLPWIRSFIGRIAELKCSNPMVTERFQSDLEQMALLYRQEPENGEQEGTADAVS